MACPFVLETLKSSSELRGSSCERQQYPRSLADRSSKLLSGPDPLESLRCSSGRKWETTGPSSSSLRRKRQIIQRTLLRILMASSGHCKIAVSKMYVVRLISSCCDPYSSPDEHQDSSPYCCLVLAYYCLALDDRDRALVGVALY